MPAKATLKNPTGPIELLCAANAVNIEGAFGTPDTEGGEERLPRFSMVAYTGEPMAVDGWRHPVVVDLDGMAIPSQRRPIRFGHSMHSGVGHSERIGVDGGQLVAEGIVSRDTPAAREVVVSGKRGFPWQVSIGARVTQSQFIQSNKFVTVNGRSFQGPLYVARKSTLGEISFVDLGADGNTSAHIAAMESHMSTPTPAPAPDTDVVNGVDTDETTTDPKPIDNGASTMIEAKAPTTDAPPDPATEMRAKAAAESRRIAAVRKTAADHPDIEAKAIEEGWDATKTELEVLRASRPKASGAGGGGGPAVHVPDNTVDGQILEAACMMTASPYSAPTLEIGRS